MHNHLRFLQRLLFFGIIGLTACMGRWQAQPHPEVIQDDYQAIVTVKADDTLEGLANTYLGDRHKAHWITEYNGIQNLHTGMRLVIPLKPVCPGGLRSDGYQTVPVLLYARIVPDADSAGALSARLFENHLQYLRENGYRTVSLDRLNDHFSLNDQLPANAMVITFDSAERWVYEIAYPLLKRYGYTAAVFIPSGSIGKIKHLTWAELAEMTADGFDIGASGITSRNLTVVPSGSDKDTYFKDLEEQISRPQKAIAENLKTTCRYFAYPGGQTDDLIIALLKKHGYRAAFTQQRGSNPFFVDNFKVRRSVMGSQEDAVQLRQNLTTFVSAELK